MTVYIDSLFFTNFFMDSILITFTSLMRRKKIISKKILIASFVSALYGTLMFFPELSFIYSVWFKIVFSLFPIIIGIKTTGIKDFFISWLFFIFITSTAGGIIFAISSFTEFGNIMQTMVSNCVMYLNINPVILVLGIGILYSAIEIYRRTCIVKLCQEDIIIKFNVNYAGMEFHVIGLIDTGCELREPLSGAPVIIVEKDVFVNIPLSGGKIKIETASGNDELNLIFPEKYCCLDKNREILWDSVIALCDRKLSDGGEYNALVNPAAIRYLDINLFEGCKK